MQQSRNHGHRVGRSVATIIFLTLTTVLVVAPPTEASSETESKTIIAIGLSDDELLEKGGVSADSFREKTQKIVFEAVEAPVYVTRFLFNNPGFTSKLLEDYNVSPGSLYFDEEDYEWSMALANGGRYNFSFVGASNKRILVIFTFFRRMNAPGLQLSGRGYVVIQVTPEEEEKNESRYEIKLAFDHGSLPLDKIAGSFFVGHMLVKDDLSAIFLAIANLAEKIWDTPEMVIDDMEFSEGTFTPAELETFRKRFSEIDR